MYMIDGIFLVQSGNKHFFNCNLISKGLKFITEQFKKCMAYAYFGGKGKVKLSLCLTN
jgi:hypothetical protein